MLTFGFILLAAQIGEEELTLLFQVKLCYTQFAECLVSFFFFSGTSDFVVMTIA